MRRSGASFSLRSWVMAAAAVLALWVAAAAQGGTIVIENLRYETLPPGVETTQVTVYADVVYQGNFTHQGRLWISSCFMNDGIGGNLAPTQPPDYGTIDSSNYREIEGEGDVLECEPALGYIPNCQDGQGVQYLGWATAAIYLGLNGIETPDEPAILDVASTECIPHYTVRGTTSGLPADGGVELTLAIYQGQQLLRTQKLDRTVNGGFRFQPPSIPEGGRFNVLITALAENTICSLSGEEGTIQGRDWLGLRVNCQCSVGEDCDGQAPTFELGFDVIVNEVSDGDLLLVPDPLAAAASSLAPANETRTPAEVPGDDHSTTEGHVSFSALLEVTPPDGTPLPVQVVPVSGSGFFTFQDPLADGSDYQVTISDVDPPGALCDVANGSGTVNGSDISDVSVECEVYVAPDDWCVVVPEMCRIDDPDCQYYFRYTGRTVVYTTDSSGNLLSGRVTNVYELQADCTGKSFAEPVKWRSMERVVSQAGSGPSSDTGPRVYMRTAPDEVVSGTIEMAGVARRDSGGVSVVRTYLNGQPIQLDNFSFNLPDSHTCGEFPAGNCDSTSRFFGQLDTTTLTNGLHTFLFEAVGADGLSLRGVAEHRIVVDNSITCGDVTLTSPQSGTTVSDFTTLAASVSASVEEVQFLLGGSAVAVDPAFPYSVSWDSNSVQDGPYPVQARAIGNGCTALSASVPIEVDNSPWTDDHSPPQGSIIAPAAGSVVNPNASGRVTLAVAATDDLAVDVVQFHIDDQLVWTDQSAPYAHNWLAPWGGHTLTARIVDECGNATWTNPVTFSVAEPDPCDDDTVHPTVAITHPAAGSSVSPNDHGRVTLGAYAADAGGVARVEFLVDNTLVWTDSMSPYGHNWPALPGLHSVKARAVDTCGNATTSSAVPFTVADPDPCSGDSTPPAIGLTQPAHGSTVTPNANGRVTLGVAASDGSGVDRVEFFIDGAHVWSDETPPYAHNWLATAGSHTFKARAVDTCGNARWSNEITFTVAGGGGGGCGSDSVKPTVGVTQPTAGSTVTPNANGRVTLRASASDASGIDQVEFHVDGSSYVWTDDTVPFVHNWPATAGSHAVRAKAFDECGNFKWSTEIPFSVAP